MTRVLSAEDPGLPIFFFSDKKPVDPRNRVLLPEHEPAPEMEIHRTSPVDIPGPALLETVRYRNENEHYRRIIENSREGVLVVKVGIIVFSNPSVRIMFGGYALKEVQGRRLTDFVHTLDLGIVSGFLQEQACIEKPDRVFSFRILTPKGTVRYLEGRATAIEWNRQPAILGFISDVTDRRHAEAALDLANRKIGLLNDLTRHDIANRLTVLRGRVKRARMASEDPRVIRELEEVEIAGRDIFNYLEMARMYQDMGLAFPQWQSLHSLLDYGRISRETRDLKISVDSPHLEIFADPLCPRVFENLIDNSLRHGNTVSEIRITTKETDAGLIILLEDNGRGVPGHEKESIFEQGVGKHTGLGLFLSREILSITGISIRETGIYGSGACFEMSVPRGAYRPDRSYQGIVQPCT